MAKSKTGRVARPGKQNAGGMKGRSGPPGNTNASRHGLESWLRRRALPLNKRHVVTFVTRYEDGLTTCKGGPENVSEVETALIRNAGRAFGAQMLVLEEAASRGFVRTVGKTWDLSLGFSRLIGFLNAERSALATLGLGRRAKEIDAGALIEAKVQAARAAKGNGDGDDNDTDT